MYSVDEMIEKSKIAQSQWEKTGQEKIDSVIREQVLRDCLYYIKY